MKIMKKTIVLSFVLAAYSGSSQAALLNLSKTPLFLTNNSISNLFFLIDDSGSMDWEVLMDTHWHYCAYDANAAGGFSSVDCGWEVTDKLVRSYGSGSYRYFEYIYKTADNSYQDDCSGAGNNSIASCPEAGVADWRTFSSDINMVYYNPSLNYKPWEGACTLSGTLCQDAQFTAAKSNPKEGTVGYPLTRNLSGFTYHVWIDDKGFSGAYPRRGVNNNATIGANNKKDLWDSNIKFVVNTNSVSVYSVSYSPNAAGLNKTETLEATLNDMSACYNVLGSRALVQQVFSGGLGYASVMGPGCKTIEQLKGNVANWYEYARRRGSNAKSAVAKVVNLFPDFRYGFTVLNKHVQTFTEMPALGTDLSTHNALIINTLFSFEWPPQGTPLRRGLERVGDYFAGKLNNHPTSPIVESCQQNFAVVITDALWNGQAPASVTHDEDGDGYKGTFADVARYYYKKDLSPLPNEVVPNPYDPATYQHLVSFLVTFGSNGSLVDTDGDGWPNPPLAVNSNWGDPFNSEPAKIDDVWHGAFNSHGLFTAAQTPDQITEKLMQVLQNITERESSVSSVAQNTTTLQTTSQVFQATFHSKTWKGNLYAYSIGLDGDIASQPAWNAGCLLTGGDCAMPVIAAASNPGKGHNNRVIITRSWNNSNTGVAFRWPSNYSTYKQSNVLPTNMYNFLKDAPFDPNTSVASEIALNQSYGAKLLNYLRGDRTEEKQNGGSYQFRDRESILGDIVHSDPLYVAPPFRNYPDNLEASAYSAFRSTYANRTPLVVTGSNDGMLHVFNSTTGEEVLAFVPGNRQVFEKLPFLSNPSYTHEYYVDGSATENDVYVNNSWKTILAGSFRNGGQGIYALNITDPSSFSEANANQIYLWEFNDKDDPNIGYVNGNLLITKVNSPSGTPKWAVIFGNGYNNSAADGYASTTGKASLFVLFIDGGLDGTWTEGTDYFKLTVGSGTVATPDGLAAPYAIDTNGDYVTDYVYAGDLKGNLWRFDLRDSTPSNWAAKSLALFSASYAAAGDQPITGRPIVGAHPKGLNYGVMVYFGTGKYLENNDVITIPNIQSFYAIWDKLDGVAVTKNQLLKQEILSEATYNFDSDNDGVDDITTEARQLSDNAINWQEPQQVGDPAVHRGWYINLMLKGQVGTTGERQVSSPLLRNNMVIFTTIIPTSSPCSYGGDSWLMEVDTNNGGVPEQTPIDFNQDGVFDTADYILVPDINGDGNPDYIPAIGKKSSSGLTATPAVFLSPDKKFEVKVLNGTGGLSTVRENPGAGPQGRQNWKQLY